MGLRLAASASIAIALVLGAIRVGHWFIHDVGPPPEVADLSLELVDSAVLDEASRADADALRAFLSIPPTQRLEAALAREDLRRLTLDAGPTGSAGALQMPGAGAWQMPGAGALTRNRQHAALVERARHYAEAYNGLLRSRSAGVGAGGG